MKDIPKKIVAIEIDKDEFYKARKRLVLLSTDGNSTELYNADFFSTYYNELFFRRFSVVLGNPPFIRYQNFDPKSRDKAISIMKNLGLKMTKLTNIWVPFLSGW